MSFNLPYSASERILTSGAAESAVAAGFMCLVLLAVSSPVTYAGWKNEQKYQELSEILSGEPSVGEYTAVSGTIQSDSNTVNSPFQSDECQLTLWEISVLHRISAPEWSQQAVGINGGSLTLELDSNGNGSRNGNDAVNREITVQNLSHRKLLDSSEKLKRSLIADSTSKFGSVEMEFEISNPGHEKKVNPTNDSPQAYTEFSRTIGFERDKKESLGIYATILSQILTPSYTTRYRETNFQSGDTLHVVGKKLPSAISFESSDSTNPFISSTPLPQVLNKYRVYYLIQFYGAPLLCLLISAVLGYAAYL